MMLVLEIAAGVMLGGIGLYALRRLKDWVAVAAWRRRIRPLNKAPMTDFQFLVALALMTAFIVAFLVYAFFNGAFR